MYIYISEERSSVIEVAFVNLSSSIADFESTSSVLEQSVLASLQEEKCKSVNGAAEFQDSYSALRVSIYTISVYTFSV